MCMLDANGDIIIDKVRIKELNLQEARRYISVLGQSPVLFSGSLSANPDVLGQFDETDLWRALKDMQLKQLVLSLEGQVDHTLLENGRNVSVRERQLIWLVCCCNKTRLSF